MIRRTLLKLALLLPIATGAALAAAPPAPSPAQTMGTDIVGDRDAAVGLYLLPWKEEAASDIDRAPRAVEVPAQPLAVDDFIRRSVDDEANAAYRRVRVEPH